MSLGNDVGLLAEQYDVQGRRQIGNFPQALSHVALIGTAFRLHEAGLVQSDKHGKALIYRLRMSVLEEALMEFTQLFGLNVTHDAETAALDADATLRKAIP